MLRFSQDLQELGRGHDPDTLVLPEGEDVPIASHEEGSTSFECSRKEVIIDVGTGAQRRE